MDASDPVYKIVVAMSDHLVPDVCVLVMNFLADIHIEHGKQIWLEKIAKVNAEYEREKVEDSRTGYSCRSKTEWPGFSFNCRVLSKPVGYTFIYNKRSNVGLVRLPAGYF
jgi:hypothetical protein